MYSCHSIGILSNTYNVWNNSQSIGLIRFRNGIWYIQSNESKPWIATTAQCRADACEMLFDLKKE